MYQEQMSQGISIADYTAPSNAAAGTVNTTGVDMSKFKRIMYEVEIGVITGAGTLDAKLQSAAASNFATAHNITGGAITQITNSSQNTIVTLEVRADQIQQQNSGDRYVRLQVVVTTNNVYYGVVGHGGETEQKPANQYDLAASIVAQRLVVSS